MGKTEEKTNVMRLLDAACVEYKSRYFETDGSLSGVDAAKAMGEDPEHVFKTLVTVAKSGKNYVFVVPVECELDLKKAARASGEKFIEMIKSKDLLPLTGYIHGGCSPIGMKKLFPTFVDETAMLYDSILFSAGKIGCQVEINPADLEKLIPFEYFDLTKA